MLYNLATLFKLQCKRHGIGQVFEFCIDMGHGFLMQLGGCLASGTLSLKILILRMKFNITYSCLTAKTRSEISLIYAYDADVVFMPVLPLIHLFHVSGYDLYE